MENRVLPKRLRKLSMYTKAYGSLYQYAHGIQADFVVHVFVKYIFKKAPFASFLSPFPQRLPNISLLLRKRLSHPPHYPGVWQLQFS